MQTPSPVVTPAPCSDWAGAAARERRAWIWPLTLAAMIFFASGHSRVAGPEILGFDKLAHFSIYGLLGTLLARVPSVARVKKLGVFTGAVLASLYGVFDEVHQSFVPGRSVEVMDWVVDTAGACLAVWLYARWSDYRAFLEAPVYGARGMVRGDAKAVSVL